MQIIIYRQSSRGTGHDHSTILPGHRLSIKYPFIFVGRVVVVLFHPAVRIKMFYLAPDRYFFTVYLHKDLLNNHRPLFFHLLGATPQFLIIPYHWCRRHCRYQPNLLSRDISSYHPPLLLL